MKKLFFIMILIPLLFISLLFIPTVHAQADRPTREELGCTTEEFVAWNYDLDPVAYDCFPVSELICVEWTHKEYINDEWQCVSNNPDNFNTDVKLLEPEQDLGEEINETVNEFATSLTGMIVIGLFIVAVIGYIYFKRRQNSVV